APIDGQWKAAISGDRGKSFEEVLSLKLDGAKLTGTFSRGKGDQNPIENGTIEGNNVKFFVTMPAVNGEPARCKFEGSLKGDQLVLQMSIPRGPVFDRTFQRVK